MATTVINSGFGYFYWMFAARLFNADEVGRASAVIAAMNLTALVANMGLPTALIGLLPKQKSVEDRVSLVTSAFAVAVVTCLVLGTAVGFGLPHFAPTLKTVLTPPVVAVFTMGVVLSVLSVISDSIAIARRQAEGLLMRNVTFTLFKLVMLYPAVRLTLNGERFLLSNWVMSLAIGFGFVSAIVFPKFYGDTRPRPHSLVSTVKATVPSALGHHFANIGGQLPMFLLPLFVISRASDAASAYFYITWMVGSIFFMVSNATSNTLFAEGSHAPDQIGTQLRKAARMIGAILVPAMLGAVLLGRFVLGLFGSDYARVGYPLLLLLVLSAVPDAITNVWVARWRVQHRLTEVAILSVSMSAIALTFAWFMIPRIGIDGAGWAWIVGQSSGVALIGLAEARRHFSPR